jgi:hypothetical protein
MNGTSFKFPCSERTKITSDHYICDPFFALFNNVGMIHGLYYVMELMYSSSTFFLAQGVFLKNFSEELMLGLLVKQLMRMIEPNSSQPK